MDRRAFLRLASAVPMLGTVAGVSWSATPEADYRRLLILVELKGANDGLNTVIPYADPTYRRLRPRLAIEREKVLVLSDAAGLHPSLEKLMPAWNEREVAILQGVGYPEPNLSHFRSIEIWDTASKSGEYLEEGWLTRAFEKRPAPREFAADAVVVGSNDMGPLAGHSARAIALTNTEQFLKSARLAKAEAAAVTRNPALAHLLKVERDIADSAARLNSGFAIGTEFPPGPFGNAAKTAAQLAANPAGIAVIHLTLNGFDTHANQAGTHATLLRQLGEGLAALREALIEIDRWNSTLILTYAEFGRRPQENQSGGTDHGTANAHFALGGRVRGGFHGEPPKLHQLDGGNLAYAVDFRSVYSTVLGQWWNVDSVGPLRGRFAPLAFLKA